MFCRKCGKEIQETEKFCKNCGAPVETSPKKDSPPSAFAAAGSFSVAGDIGTDTRKTDREISDTSDPNKKARNGGTSFFQQADDLLGKETKTDRITKKKGETESGSVRFSGNTGRATTEAFEQVKRSPRITH